MASQPQQPEAAAPPQITVAVAANLLKTSEDEIRDLSKRHVLPPIRKGQLPLIETVQRYVEHKRDGRRSVHLAGPLIGKSAQWIRRLIAEGFIPKQTDGTVLERDVYLGYIRWLTDEQRRATKVAAESRVRDARAREIELRIAEREGRLIEIVDMEEVLDEYGGMLRAELSGLPARVTRDLVLRRTIEQAIEDILNRVTAAAQQARDRLGPADNSDEAVPAPNTGQVGRA